MVSFARGLSAGFARAGSPENIVVVQKSAFSQSLSSLPRSSSAVIQSFDHVHHEGAVALVSPELHVEPWVTVPGQAGEIFMAARGVEPVFFRVMDALTVVQGSRELRGNQVLLGPAARSKLGGVRVGDRLEFFGERWTVGGLFQAGGSSLEYAILADLDDLMRAAQRDELSSFTLAAASVEEVPRLIRALEDDRRVLVTAMAEKDYYVASGRTYAILGQLGLLVAIIVSLGAIFGGMNTMYTAVASRTREIGTLRALGFSGAAIMSSFLLESVLLGAAGGLLGVALGLLAHGARVNVMSASIRFDVTPGVALAALGLSIAVGLLGGLPPALRAARLSVLQALKQI
jgi:putative ABC transport system permease protein